MPDTASPRVSLLAAASLLLGLLSLLLWGLAGVPALVLGLYGLRSVNASDGRLRGRRLAVIGMVLGACTTALSVLGVALLLLWWVNAKAQQIECADNFRQIGRAVSLEFIHNEKRFPGAALPNPALPPEQRLSWLAGLLPFLDQQQDGTGRWQSVAARLDLRQGWDDPANRPALSTNVPRFLCPSCPSFDPSVARGLTHYVGITGIGSDAVWYPKNNPQAGFFGYERVIGEADLGGGLSYTLVATETTLRNGPWLAANESTLRGLDPQATPYIGPGRQFGGCHPKGFNALFADGSCHFYNSSIEIQAFERMIPLARGEP
jgi:prepilin-type processing-associated H-X9-DG protein